MTTDEELMVASGRGSDDAFGELFARYRQRVWGFFRRRVADRERAEDLAQDVFVALLRGARRYEPRAPFRAYLFGIAFRVLAAERRRLTSPSFNLDELPSASVTAGSAEDGLLVREALARLDQGDREVLMLREFEQLSYDEIGVLLGAPASTVRSRLFRARRAVRRLLTPVENAGATGRR